MAILNETYGSGAAGAWSIARKLDDNYVGAAFEGIAHDGSDTIGSLVDIGFDANGDLDEDALLAAAAGNNFHVRRIYDQTGNGNHWNVFSGGLGATTTNGKIDIVSNGVINRNQAGKPALEIDTSEFSSGFDITNDPSLGGITNASLFINITVKSGLEERTELFESQDGDLLQIWNSPGDYEGLSADSYYVDGVQVPVFDREDLWVPVNNVDDDLRIVSVINGVYPNVPTQMDAINNIDDSISLFCECLIYSGDKSTDRSSIEQNMMSLNEVLSLPKGSVTFNSVAFSNGVVDFFSTPYAAQGDITKVEQVPINSGVATMTVERDPTKDYFGVVRGMTQDFTGTLASDPVGDVISTGLNLTGLSIGGANDDHYIFRATGGAGAGTEVTVTGRTGGDITVTDASAFGTGTEFTLGRFVNGISRVLPKD